MAQKTITRTFNHVNETKNKQRFDEAVPEGEKQIVGGLYIIKEEAGDAKVVKATFVLETPEGETAPAEAAAE